MEQPAPPLLEEPAPETAPEIYTYHCICTQLVLASTYKLSELRRRRLPGLDQAYILPLPPLPRRASESASGSGSDSLSSSSSDDDDDDDEGDDEEQEKSKQEDTQSTSRNPSKDAAAKKNMQSTKKRRRRRRRSPATSTNGPGQGYSLLLSTVQDRRPLIVRREDGFEKRWLWRCGRCRVVVGYQLDPIHFITTPTSISTTTTTATTTRTTTTGTGGGILVPDAPSNMTGTDSSLLAAADAPKNKEADVKLVYLLPKGLLSTEDTSSGKNVTEEDVDLRSA
ncbi:MAG: hypothetical protein M1815_001677 [Lichina confinis]|nr:MAG: hypothetical protein M1815_001677 [Lichina confinis]